MLGMAQLDLKTFQLDFCCSQTGLIRPYKHNNISITFISLSKFPDLTTPEFISLLKIAEDSKIKKCSIIKIKVGRI